jgi:hypothetical protein
MNDLKVLAQNQKILDDFKSGLTVIDIANKYRMTVTQSLDKWLKMRKEVWDFIARKPKCERESDIHLKLVLTNIKG